ncbi:MAG: serine/threonine protein kinase [Ktedonobacteraceae bacterium]|nr:serine/threonine protein kinase [Ktedonobacteraceae bacterium]
MQDTPSPAGEATIKYVGRRPLALPGAGNDESLRYHIVRQIGEGGYGAVYEARDTFYNNHRVAIKSINLAGLNATEVIEATDGFNREVKLLSGLRHPHLPRVYDHFTDPEHWYLVMDYIDGETLETYLEHSRNQLRYLGLSFGGCLPLPEVFNIVLQLCSVLEYLHTLKPPIIFRDLKPANIMRTARGQLYLIDFGIARHFKPGQAKDTIPLGSPGYAAPEQYGKAQTDPRADIYSLGALLHHLLTGSDPAENAFHFAPLPALPSTLAGLDRLLSDMLSNNPAQRPPSIRVVGQAIAAYSRNIAASPRPTMQPGPFGAPQHTGSFSLSLPPLSPQQSGAFNTPLPPLPPPFQQQPGAFGAPLPPLPPPLSAQQPYYVPRQPIAPPTPLPSSLYPTSPTGAAQQLQMQPPLRQQAIGNSRQATSNSKISRRAAIGIGAGIFAIIWGGNIINQLSRDHSTTSIPPASSMPSSPSRPLLDSRLTYTEHTQPVVSLAWSSDGQYIASVEQGARSFNVWNAINGETLRQSSPLSSAITVLSWSPNGDYIACGLADGTVTIRSAIKDLTLSTRKFHKKEVRALTWSPDRESIASAGVDGTVHIWNYQDGSNHITIKNTQQGTAAHTPVSLAWSPDNQYLATGGTTPQIFDATTGQLLISYSGYSDIYALDWAPNGEYLAAIDRSGTLYCWNVGYNPNYNTLMWQKNLLSYDLHTDNRASVKWSPDSSYIAAATGDSNVYLWDKLGNSIGSYQSQSDVINTIAWNPASGANDTYTLASGSDDTTVSVWPFSPGDSN